MTGNISKSKGFQGDTGPQGIQGKQGIQGIQGVKGDTPKITFVYDENTGDLFYSSDGVLVDKEYISSENLATKDDVNDEIHKISDNLIVDIQEGVVSRNDLLVYDRNGKPTKNIENVYAGVLRFKWIPSDRDAGSIEEDSYSLMLQEKTHIIDKTDKSTVYAAVGQRVFVCSSGDVYVRLINNLSANKYPGFDDYSTLPWDGLDEHAPETAPLSAKQGYVLDQKKADKEEVSAARDAILTTLSEKLSTKENNSNKAKVIDDNSNDVLYPSAKAVKTYVDSNVSDINTKLLVKANRSEFEDLKEKFEFKSNKVTTVDDTANNAKFPTTKAVKNYVDDKVVTITASLKNKAEQSTVTELNNNVERHLANKTNSIDENANDTKYPTTKAVKDYVESMIEECIQRMKNEASTIRTTTLTLYASQWLGSDGQYSQTVSIANVTQYSKIDLQPTAEQLTIFHDKDIAFVTENDNGVITVYCIGQKPTGDYVMQATITEVKNDE